MIGNDYLITFSENYEILKKFFLVGTFRDKNNVQHCLRKKLKFGIACN